MKSHVSPSQVPWSLLLEQMDIDILLLKGLSALLGGDVCPGKAGGRQPGLSPGFSPVPSAEERV